MKNIIVVISTLVLIFAGFFISMALVWSINPKDMLYIPIWLATIISFIIFLVNKRIGTSFLVVSALLWLIQSISYIGLLFLFEYKDLALWALIGLPTVACLCIIYFGMNDEFQINENLKKATKKFAFLIPILGILSYANKNHEMNLNSNFYNLEETEFIAKVKPSFNAFRQFELKLSSNEVKHLLSNKINSQRDFKTSFRVNMSFRKINEIELFAIEDFELENKIIWKKNEINGETSFLSAY